MEVTVSAKPKLFTFILGMGIGALALSPFLFYNQFQKNLPSLNLFAPQVTPETTDTVKKILKQNTSVAQTIINQLHAQHAKNVKELQNAFSFTQQEWDELFQALDYMKQQDAEYIPEKTPTTSDHAYVLRTQELLKKYGVNPDKVTIILVNNPTKSMNASTGQGYSDSHIITEIEINVPQFERHSQDIQDALIKHEIMHIKNYDSLERALICNLLEKHGLNAEDYENSASYRSYYHHQEFRADLMATSDDIATGIALQKSFIDYLNRFPEKQNKNSHPSDLQRFYAVARLISYLEAEIRLKSETNLAA